MGKPWNTSTRNLLNPSVWSCWSTPAWLAFQQSSPGIGGSLVHHVEARLHSESQNAMEHNEGTFSTLSWTCKLQMWNNLDLSTLAQWEWYARGASCATERGGSNAPSLCTKLLLWPGFLGPYVVPTMTCQVRRVSFYLCQCNPPPHPPPVMCNMLAVGCCLSQDVSSIFVNNCKNRGWNVYGYFHWL